MAGKADNKKDLEAEIWNAINAFEQMLEAMPNDRVSLEALSHAYEQIGDHTSQLLCGCQTQVGLYRTW